MQHQTALLVTVAVGLGLAFVLGLLAARVRLPPILGYLLAGIAIGPFTPGFVADVNIASQLAEIGVILLMFGVGLHFSIRDLLAVKSIALPGAAVQIITATFLGTLASRLFGWPWGSGIVFGLSLSVASTVVLLRALEEAGILDSINGRIAVGWLVVEDLATVLALVLLPALAIALDGTLADGAPIAENRSLPAALAITLGKVAAFVVLMLYVGSRAVPWLLERVARIGTRELFTLAVLTIALCIAVGAAALFGVSFALGAFFAGVVISESDLSHQAAAEALPLQEAFAVLFFVAAGMLFDPAVIVEHPLLTVVTLMIIVWGKSAAAFAIVLLFRYPVRTALTVSAGLAQIGEFSFILAALGVSLGLLTDVARSVIIAASIISIALNPLIFRLIGPVDQWLSRHPRLVDALERKPHALIHLPDIVDEEQLDGHIVIVGFGRVGGTIGRAVKRLGMPYVVLEQNREVVEALRERDIPVLYGDATRPGILENAKLDRARLLAIATPGAYQTRLIVERARQLNPDIEIVARTHSQAEQVYLEQHGVGRAVMGERELALGMTRYALERLGTESEYAEDLLRELRARRTPAEVDEA